MKLLLRILVMMMAAMTALETATAALGVPKASGVALGITRGRPFDAGMVFVNGRYLKPPYTVERWGTGLRINNVPVTGSIVGWSEFARTQKGFRVEMRDDAATPARLRRNAAAAKTPQDIDRALDDLFGDEGNTNFNNGDKPKRRKVYCYDGAFAHNSTTRELVEQINQQRLAVDRHLRAGGIVFFGENYARVDGDARTQEKLLNVLPELMRSATDELSFKRLLRENDFHFISEPLAEDLYRHRVDYPKLMERREELRKVREWKKMLEDV